MAAGMSAKWVRVWGGGSFWRSHPRCRGDSGKNAFLGITHVEASVGRLFSGKCAGRGERERERGGCVGRSHPYFGVAIPPSVLSSLLSLSSSSPSFLPIAFLFLTEPTIHLSCPPPFHPRRTAHALHARLISSRRGALRCAPHGARGERCRDVVWAECGCQCFALPRTIFAIQIEPSTWPGADDDDDGMLESVSDPEEEAGFGAWTTGRALPPRTPRPAPRTSLRRPSPTHTTAPTPRRTPRQRATPATAACARWSTRACPSRRSPMRTLTWGPPVSHALKKGMGRCKGREHTVGDACAELEEKGDEEENFVDPRSGSGFKYK
ncbi:hypothetical protein C8R45DRAFT_381786 [Mycena sanguinolenta]|nr:hypothetical protein C8R45DRAFT_381786 [Mycena sanguinolenta]